MVLVREIEDIRRREFIAGVFGSALLIACGDDDNEDDAQPTPDANAGYPREVSHFLGSSTIPARPERIVAVSDFSDLDYLTDLGLEPVLYGFSNAYDTGARPWQTTTANLKSMPASAEPDLEAIAGAQPDLIIAMQSVEKFYDQLSQIAPTIVLGWDTSWRDGIQIVASAFALEEKARERIREADVVIAEAKKQLEPIAGKKMMVGFQYRSSFVIWGTTTAGAVFFSELGMNFVGGPDPRLTSTSLEQAQILNEAEILLSVATDPAGIEAQEQSPLFRSIPAVQNGNYGVLEAPQSLAFGSAKSTIAIKWIVPQVTELLLQLSRGEGKKLS